MCVTDKVYLKFVFLFFIVNKDVCVYYYFRYQPMIYHGHVDCGMYCISDCYLL